MLHQLLIADEGRNSHWYTFNYTNPWYLCNLQDKTNLLSRFLIITVILLPIQLESEGNRLLWVCSLTAVGKQSMLSTKANATG